MTRTRKLNEANVPKLRSLTREQSGHIPLPSLRNQLRLMAHPETRGLPIYGLKLAKLGLKLAATAPHVFQPQGSHVDGCEAGGTSSNYGHREAKGLGTKQITQFLARKLQSTMTSRTGRRGKSDFSLDRKPDREKDTGTGNAADFLTIVQEQWCLKIEAGRDPDEFVVVVQLEEPSAN